MSSAGVLIILPTILIGVMLLVFSTQVSGISNARNKIFCPFPDYNNGINNATVTPAGCSIINHPKAYSCQPNFLSASACTDKFIFWNITVPSCIFFSCGQNGTTSWVTGFQTGWATFTIDTATSFFYRIGQVFAIMIAVITVPASISALTWFVIPEVILVLWFICGMVLVFKPGAGG